jgi:putative FmdB family regulatory protein
MTFDYHCKKCDWVWEVFRLEDQKEQCPECKSWDTEKYVPSPRFILKGSGFYVNDYPKKK